MGEPGYIYILTNPAFGRNYLKIGKTTRTPEERAGEISGHTGLPSPFEVAYAVKVSDCDKAEIRVHRQLSKHRVSGDREFFKLPLEKATKIIDGVVGSFKIEPDSYEGHLAAIEQIHEYQAERKVEQNHQPKSAIDRKPHSYDFYKELGIKRPESPRRAKTILYDKKKPYSHHRPKRLGEDVASSSEKRSRESPAEEESGLLGTLRKLDLLPLDYVFIVLFAIFLVGFLICFVVEAMR